MMVSFAIICIVFLSLFFLLCQKLRAQYRNVNIHTVDYDINFLPFLSSSRKFQLRSIGHLSIDDTLFIQ